MKDKQIDIKVSGEKSSVENFIFEMEKIFPLMVKSKILSNDKDPGMHCFISLDPNVTNKSASNKQGES